MSDFTERESDQLEIAKALREDKAFLNEVAANGGQIEWKELKIELSAPIDKVLKMVTEVESKLRLFAETRCIITEGINEPEYTQFLSPEMLEVMRAEVLELSIGKQEVRIDEVKVINPKPSPLDAKAWWAYQVDENDANYAQKPIKNLDCMFYEYDQSFVIEAWFQKCNKRYPKGYPTTKDVQKRKCTINGGTNKEHTMYDVWGDGPLADLDHTNWVQKNTKGLMRKRRIFRFEEKTREFQTILKESPEYKAREEEKKLKKKPTREIKIITLKGSKKQVATAKSIMMDFYNDDLNHMCIYDVAKPI